MGLTVLDAGVVIAGLDASDAHHGGSIDSLVEARERGDALVLPASAYAEILVRPAQQGSEVVARADAGLDVMGISVAVADREVARAAAILRARYTALRLPDALVIATAIRLNADFLLTTDLRWMKLARLGLRGRLVRVG
jgi:predicted nucleic acid-binding protein